MGDRNFDDLAPRFARNIYGSHKGQIRLEVINRDFSEHIPFFSDLRGVRVLDLGAGQGQFTLSLAQRGADVTLFDHSKNMLDIARDRWQVIKESNETDGRLGKATFIHAPLQNADTQTESYPLVLGHAVLEWMEQPESGFEKLVSAVEVGGYLSVIGYNAHGLVFKNLLRGNFKKFDRQNFKAFKGSLTPISPLTPEVLITWSKKYRLKVVEFSGIRVFHDYILDKAVREADPEGGLAKELEYSRLEPFNQTARYLHFLFKKEP